ncbi:MAG: hypothetical protein IT535_02395 [Bauldia sp.]|nr:hypothetical protein [Bauldia sp.]
METARGRWFLGEYARRHRATDTATVLDALRRIEASIARPAAAAPDAARRMGPPIADALAELRLVLSGPRPGESAPDRLLRAQSQLNMLEHRLHSFVRELGYELPAGRPLSKQPVPVQGNLPAPGGPARPQPATIPAPTRNSYWSSDKPLTPAVPNLPARTADPTRPRPEPVERSAILASPAPMPQAGDLRLSAPQGASPAFAQVAQALAAMQPGRALVTEPPVAPAAIAEPVASAPAGTEVVAERPRTADPTLRMTAGEKAALFS